MARTIQEIYTTLEGQMALQPTLLPLLSNPSKTAIWRLFLWLFAYGANIVETLFDAFKSEVETKGKAAKVGNAQWYRDRVLEFQMGDNLTFLNGIYQYPTLDASKKIVSNCAITEGFDSLIGGVINIKVARTVSGTLTALDGTQVNALTSYMRKIRFAGTKFKIISTDGDILKIGFDIYYDPILTLATVQTNVKTVIENYIKSLPFDGNLMVTKLIDALQLVEGVNDVKFTSAASKATTGDNYSTFDRIKNPVGGYFKISTSNLETLNDTINYISI